MSDYPWDIHAQVTCMPGLERVSEMQRIAINGPEDCSFRVLLSCSGSLHPMW